MDNYNENDGIIFVAIIDAVVVAIWIFFACNNWCKMKTILEYSHALNEPK